MALIRWDDSLSVKVTAIDQQHQKLIVMINDLSNAMKQGKGKEVIGETINGLIGYTREHFRKEEMFFDKFGYDDKDGHKKEHAAFVQKVSEFKAGFEKGNLSLTVEVMKFLSDWLQNHIKASDQKYAACFNENGLR